MPSYTPTTTLSPTAVNQDSGKLDEMIGIVQGMLQQRQQSRDSAFRGEQMQRTKQVWMEEDQNRALTSRQDQNFRSLATNRNFNTEQVNQMLLDNEINPNQANALIPLATDYVSPEQRLQAFAEGLSNIDIYDPAQLNALFNDTGADRNEAHRLLTQYEQRPNLNTGTGSRPGSGDGGGTPPETVSNAVANQSYLNRAFESAGLPPVSLPATPQNAQHFERSLEAVQRASNDLSTARSKYLGVLQNYGTIYVGGQGEDATASFRNIPGYTGYVVRIDSEGNASVTLDGRRVRAANDPKVSQLINMVSGTTAADARNLAAQRQAYRTVLQAEAARLSDLNAGISALDSERE